MSDVPPAFDPNKPFTEVPPKFDPNKPFTEAATTKSGPPDPADTRGKARVSTAGDENLSILDRLWRGLQGKDVSVPGRIAFGMADPAVGMAQMGSRVPVMPDAMPFMPPEMAKAAEPDTKAVDALVAQREHAYQGTRQSAQPGQPLGTDWARLGGNIASPVTLAAGGALGKAAQGVGLGGRLALSTLGGAGLGASEPVAKPGGFATEKAKQIGIGGATGLVGGALGEAGGSLIAKAIGGVSLPEIEKDIISAYRRAVRPTSTAKGATGIEQKNRQILDVVDTINKNKANLEFEAPMPGAPPTRGQTPRNLHELSQAIEQTKPQIFKQYDAMAQTADASRTAAPNLHLPEFQQASRLAADAERVVAQAENRVTQAAAQQQSAGNNVYRTSVANQARQQAETELRQARQALEQAQQTKAAAKEKTYSVRIDMAPFARQLGSTARERELMRFHGGDAVKINSLAEDLFNQKSMTLGEMQDFITRMNKEMQTYYKTERGALGDALAPVLRDMREALDKRIEAITEPGYQGLKNQYGALKSVEREVARAVENTAKLLPGGLSGQIANLISGGELLHAIAHPEYLIKAIGTKGTQLLMARLRDPNRAIARIFAQRASVGTPAEQAASSAFRKLGGPVGGTAGALGGQVGAMPPQELSYPWLPAPR
jgi:hypothetical protein